MTIVDMDRLDEDHDRMEGNAAEESLRVQVRAALDATGTSQRYVAEDLGVSTKHLCQMLTGGAPLTLGWAERILAVCGMRVEVVVLKGKP